MKKKIILGIAIILLILGGISYSDYTSKKEVRRTEQNLKTANQELEKSSVGLLTASLKFYYAIKGDYPSVISDMKEVLETNKESSYATLEKAISKVNNIQYRVRGDRQAYKITYTNQRGENITVEGNYRSDFHNNDK